MKKQSIIKIITTILAVALAACAYWKETGSIQETLGKQIEEAEVRAENPDEPSEIKAEENSGEGSKKAEDTAENKTEVDELKTDVDDAKSGKSGEAKDGSDGEKKVQQEEGSVWVENIPEIVNEAATYTGTEPLEIIRFSVSDPENAEQLSTESKSFGFGAAKEGKPSQLTVDNQTYFDSLERGVLAWDNRTEEKVLYLTFDCGYEYENLTADMLDVLKEKEVSAAFFCTLDYLETAPQVVKRMIDEGHIVGNHSTTHPADSAALSREEMAWEILGVDNYLRANFGYTSSYFRFPAGVYSENALDLVDDVGFKSVFWSLAHADWDPKDQPGVEKSFKTITERLHPGAVILLHTTSPDNAAILADYIDYARQQGYTFRSLDEYPWD